MLGVVTVCVCAGWAQETVAAYFASPGKLGDILCLVLSAIAILAGAAVAGCCVRVILARRKGEHARCRVWSVLGSGVLWCSVTSSLTMIMAWSGFAPSPEGKSVCVAVTWQLLAVFMGGALMEAFSYAKQRSPVARKDVSTLSGGVEAAMGL
mmetsp:Transcript_42395/g.98648  ORF Transcript_42395/g.98648 Transcript_42395/m.98648 type:complete len:152 (+) Transcript_42395:3-458(+)